jgi:hypothetical protein
MWRTPCHLVANMPTQAGHAIWTLDMRNGWRATEVVTRWHPICGCAGSRVADDGPNSEVGMGVMRPCRANSGTNCVLWNGSETSTVQEDIIDVLT